MNQRKPTSKEQVRIYLRKRIAARTPPPDMEQIRRELGMTLIEASRKRKS